MIGKSGTEVDALRRWVYALTGRAVQINMNEIKRPELDAKLMAQSVAEQLQNRVSFRRAMKRSLASAVRSGAQGVRVKRRRPPRRHRDVALLEQDRRVRSLHTLRADIDYGFVEARTTFGRIGVKVWINKGEIMPEGYELTGEQTRLGEVDARRRRGGARGAIEELGPARPDRRRRGPGGGPGGGGGGGGGGGTARADAVVAAARRPRWARRSRRRGATSAPRRPAGARAAPAPERAPGAGGAPADGPARRAAPARPAAAGRSPEAAPRAGTGVSPDADAAHAASSTAG